MSDLNYLWHKVSYLIVHTTTLWLLFVFFSTSFAAFLLAFAYDKIPAHTREARLARLTAKIYICLGLILWIFSAIFD